MSKKTGGNNMSWLRNVLSDWLVCLDRWRNSSSKKSQKESQELDEWIEKCKKDPKIKNIVIRGRRY